MLGVHECRHPARLLRFRNYLQGDGGFAGRFRTEDLDHAAAGKAANPKRGVERDRSRGDDRDRHNGFFRAQPHDRAFAKLLFNLCERKINRFCPFISHKRAAPLNYEYAN